MTKSGHAEPSESLMLQYGELEKLLVDLGMGTRQSVASRFRKLRPKFEADNLLSKPGNRISYDLARVVSIYAIYSLNSVAIPQADAVRIVISNWPEIARAFLLATRADDCSGRNSNAPARGQVRFYVDAFPSPDNELVSWASCEPLPEWDFTYIGLELGPIIAALQRIVPHLHDQLVAAIRQLETTFGWEKLDPNEAPRLPERLDSGFFGTGPYFNRARALIKASDQTIMNPRELARFQAWLDYLEAPPPIDSWKKFIGTDPDQFRLFHLLSAHGADVGLKSKFIVSETQLSAASPVDRRALELIADGEKHLGRLVGGLRS